jgi:uncharacterized membrane protein
MILEKFKSKFVWVSIFAIIAMILRKYGVLETDITWLNDIFTAILAILVTLGVLNNPDQKNF